MPVERHHRHDGPTDARDSLPPGAHLRPGPENDVDRAQPYDEQLGGLRMHEQPVDPEDAR